MSLEAIIEGIGLALSRAIAALPSISEKIEEVATTLDVVGCHT